MNRLVPTVPENQSVLPSRSTLLGWNPDSLSSSSGAVQTAGQNVGDGVSTLDDAIGRMPELRGWSGQAHDAATGMFGRADAKAREFTACTDAVASALGNGATAIGAARSALLAKADAVDSGPLNVTDQWVVLVDPVMATEEEIAKLQALALQEQGEINALLCAVGDADNATADAIVAAGAKHGFVMPGEPSDWGELMVPTSTQRPPDQVPDPGELVGMAAQESIRRADQQQQIREVIDSTNEYGEEVTTVIKQDGSKAVTTKMDPFEYPSKMNFYMMEEFDKDGNFLARTSSWRDLGNDCDYTTVTYADGSHLTMSMDSTGHRTAGFTSATGRHSSVPVELIDNLSTATGAAMSGMEKHIAHGGSLPMITAESVDKMGTTMKFGGPALGMATTVFDMYMAETDKDRCIALVAGIAGGGGGWGGVEFGAALGATSLYAAPVTVPLFAFVFGLGGAYGGAEMGEFVGEVICPN